MKGDMPIAYVVALILGIAVLVALGYWFYTTGGRLGPTISQQDCTRAFQQHCEEWKNSGFPSTMKVRVRCTDSTARALKNVNYGDERGDACQICGCQDTTNCGGCSGNWATVYLDVSSGQWWNYIAPGCAEAYGIEIKTTSDCG